MKEMPEQGPDFRSGFVALLGRPNVGKSTLLNSMLGERLAAVSPKAQTTRRRFRGILSSEKSQIIFIDTPGIHVAPQSKKLNVYCVEEAAASLKDADVLLYIIDGSRKFLGASTGTDEALLIETIRTAQKIRQLPLYVAINKLDQVVGDGSRILEEVTRCLGDLEIRFMLPLAAKTGKGVDRLRDLLVEEIPIHPAYFPLDIVSDEQVRVIAGEHIQEQLFRLLGEEVPYECAVEVLSFLEPQPGVRKKTTIEANIHVGRSSQKEILIGERAQRSRKSVLRPGRASKIFWVVE